MLRDGIGGICGGNKSYVRYCYNTGYVVGNGQNSYIAGGIAGICIDSSITEYSYNEGDVYSSVSSGESDVAGIVGCNGNGQLHGTNTIQYCYNTGKIEGKKWIGGIVGKSTNNTIRNSYSIGEVKGTDTIGGCIGYSSGDTKTNIYYLKDKVKLNNVVSNVAYNSTADATCLKTDTQFKNTTATTESVKYLLNGNSATGAWAVDASINGGYPYLTAFDNTNIWVRDANKKPMLKWQVENE